MSSLVDQVLKEGTLVMEVVRAELFRNTEMFGTMDPFFVINYKDQTIKSHICKNGGQHPIWNEKVELEYESNLEDMKLLCYDKDLIMNDIVGEAYIKLSQVAKEKGIQQWFPLTYHG
jgi:Ca2+-dependent lipid-binding protein